MSGKEKLSAKELFDLHVADEIRMAEKAVGGSNMHNTTHLLILGLMDAYAQFDVLLNSEPSNAKQTVETFEKSGNCLARFQVILGLLEFYLKTAKHNWIESVQDILDRTEQINQQASADLN